MGKLLYTENIGYDLSDWEGRSLVKVFAGADCVMALTSDGEVLQKAADPKLEARTQFWRNIQDIAISHCYPAAVIGLVSDGTCMIAKRPARRIFEREPDRFDKLNGAIRGWQNVVEVAASDAFFALTKEGRVLYTALEPRQDDYREVSHWQDVAHIVTGVQNALFGITREGTVLCAGGNCNRDVRNRLSRLRNVAALCPLGSESQAFLILYKDGTLHSDRDPSLDLYPRLVKAVGAHYWGCYALLHEDGTLHIGEDHMLGDCARLEGAAVTSFAFGNVGYDAPFLLAVTK